jgi:hypothetical protein
VEKWMKEVVIMKQRKGDAVVLKKIKKNKNIKK